MGAKTRIFKENILTDYKSLLSKDHKSEKQLRLFEFFYARLARSKTYEYKVRGLKDELKIHHNTIKKSIDRFVLDNIFLVKDLGHQVGYSIQYNPKILEAELDESFNPHTVDHTNKIQSKIHWLDHTGFIGREIELKKITSEIKKRKSIMLVGESGVGKTAIMQKLFYDYNQTHNIIYANYGDNAYKDFLISIIYSLFHLYKNVDMWCFKENKLDINSCEWSEFKKILKPLKNPELFNVIIKSIENKDYIIMIDHLEKMRQGQKANINRLMDYCCVIGSAWELTNNKHIRSLWFQFEKIKLKPFNKKEAIPLVDHYYKEMAINTTHPKLYKKRIITVTGGNPLAIINRLKKDTKEPLVDRQAIREIDSPQSVKEFNMSFLLIFFAALLIASRFIALGVGDRTLYVFAGVTAAGFKAFTAVASKKKTENTATAE